MQSTKYTLLLIVVLALWTWAVNKLELAKREMFWKSNLPETYTFDIPDEEDNPFKTLQILYEIDDADGEIVCTGSRNTLIPISYIIHISIRPDKLCAAWIENNRICIYGHWHMLIFRSLNHFRRDDFSQMFVSKRITRFKVLSFKISVALNELLETVNLKVSEKVL